MRARIITALVLLALPLTARAQGLSRRARVEVQPLFGEGTLMSDGWCPVLVDVENLTRGSLSGELRVSVSSYRSAFMRAELPFDVPAGETRRAVVPVFTGESGSTVSVSFVRADGRVLATGQTSNNYSPVGRSAVVFGDPPRLRGALLELDVNENLASGPRQVRFPVGAVRFDPATSDPVLPERAGGWSTVKLLIASAHVLARASASQRRAIEDWLGTGGQLLVFPRSEADLRQPWVQELIGTVHTGGEPPDPDSALVPVGVERFGLACNEERVEVFGCSRPVGSGRVFVAGYDGASGGAIEGGAPRALVTALLATSEDLPVLLYARGTENLSQRYYQDAQTFGAMRATLDPNEGFRPALLLVALVLIFYVVLIGPVNFSFVQKRNKPTLALLTTPLIATSCVVLLMAVGYLGKGVTMRYRRVEMVESVEGQTRSPARRYTGLFSTRPGRFDLPAGDADTLIHRIGGGSGRSPVQRTEGDSTRLVDFRAGLWETTFLREDRIVELGGAVTFEQEGLHLTRVVNGTTQVLRGAVLIDSSGAIYRVGDVAPGASAEIPSARDATISRVTLIGRSSGAAPTLAATMGLGGDPDELAHLRALLDLLGNRFIPDDLPTLYARLPAEGETIGGTFSAEFDERWLRVRPIWNGPAVRPAPSLEPDPYGYGPEPPVSVAVESLAEAPAVQPPEAQELIDALAPDGGAPEGGAP